MSVYASSFAHSLESSKVHITLSLGNYFFWLVSSTFQLPPILGVLTLTGVQPWWLMLYIQLLCVLRVEYHLFDVEEPNCCVKVEYQSRISKHGLCCYRIAVVEDLTQWITSTLDLCSHYLLWQSKHSVLTSDPVLHQCTKHFKLDLHFIQEKVVQGLIAVHHIPSEEQTLEILTKFVSSSDFPICKPNSELNNSTHEFVGEC